MEKYKILYCLIGLLFILLGFFGMIFGIGMLAGITVAMAFILFFSGILEIIIYAKTKGEYNELRPSILVSIVHILISLLLIFNLKGSIIVIVYIFALWFILLSIFNLIKSNKNNKKNNLQYFFSIFFNFLTALIGFILLFNPFLTALFISMIVSVYFVAFGITYIIMAFRT